MKTSEVLRIVKPLLRERFYTATIEHKPRFICHAIRIAEDKQLITKDDYIRVSNIVEKRLGGHATLEGWLASKGVVPVTGQDRNRIQQHRHAWLDMMIKEFEAKGD